ncbi:MAG: hypothetical protein JWN17_2460, partial [Frankiales bacterium]|nr:hypothetical protein [Frankiales bacterium]
MALPPPPTPVLVVLPLEGDPLPLLAAVSALAAGWPEDVDAQLVVPAGPLSGRDLALLGELGDEVRVVQTTGQVMGFGELVARAVEGAAAPALVLDAGALPGADALGRLAAGLA